MNLFDTISEDIKTAMKAREKVRLEALRGIKKEFLEAKTAPGAGGELTDDNALKIIIKLAKQRRESAKIYADAGRKDLADNELAQGSLGRGTHRRTHRNHCKGRRHFTRRHGQGDGRSHKATGRTRRWTRNISQSARTPGQIIRLSKNK